MNSDYEKVLTASQLDKMKKDWVNEGRKQGAIDELEKIQEILDYPDMDDIYETKILGKHCKKRLCVLKGELK